MFTTRSGPVVHRVMPQPRASLSLMNQLAHSAKKDNIIRLFIYLFSLFLHYMKFKVAEKGLEVNGDLIREKSKISFVSDFSYLRPSSYPGLLSSYVSFLFPSHSTII